MKLLNQLYLIAWALAHAIRDYRESENSEKPCNFWQM
jgi:hypothetical protein